jgi:phosphoribosyl 1,2-cyclic phosphodiesterase
VALELVDGSQVILDAGTGLRMLGKSLAAGALAGHANQPAVPAKVTIVLTHRHSDHVNGLAHFAPLLNKSRRVRLACNEVTTHDLRALVTQQLSAPLFPTIGGVVDAVEVDAFDATDVLRVTSSLRVRALMAHHPGGASVLLVEDNHGPLLAYAPDNELAMTSSDPSLMEWRTNLQNTLRGIPVLIHDATYSRHEISRHEGWGHSSADEAVDFAAACEAGTVYLTHHHPDRSDSEIDHMVAGCTQRSIAKGQRILVHAAAEGMTIPIG